MTVALFIVVSIKMEGNISGEATMAFNQQDDATYIAQCTGPEEDVTVEGLDCSDIHSRPMAEVTDSISTT